MRSPYIFSHRYNTNLADFGINKPFALDRGELVLKKLSEDFGQPIDFDEPEPVSEEEILLVHTKRYLESLRRPETWIEIFEFKPDEFSRQKATRALPELLDDIALKCGGTVRATERALEFGVAANLGGGYHHAFPDQGRGYCVLNDIAIAVRSLRKRGMAKKFMIVDLDFHQGDGTALIFQRDADVFTLSVHSEEGWPEEKQQSTMDVAITQAESFLYLKKTEAAITQALQMFAPDMVIYVAGSDPYEKDVLPGTTFIKLPLSTMKQRDHFVIDTFFKKGIPLSMVFAGGYGPDVWEVHYWATRYLLERSGTLIGNTVS